MGLLLFTMLGAAEAWTGRAGSTAGNVLLRGTPGARTAGMGGAYTAFADGPLALYYNAAGLGALERNRLLLQYDNSFLDINRSDVAFGRPVAGGGFGLGVTVIDYGTMIRTTTASKTNAGSFSASDMLIRTGYGRPVSDRLSLGGTLGYYRMEIADVIADGVTADVGALYQSPWSGLTFGASVRNIGTRAQFTLDEEELPLTLVLGASYRPANRLLFVLDYESARNQGGVIRAGAEYQLIDALALRVGYNGSNETDNGLTLGAGFSFNDIRLDYAYVPFGDLGQSHRISAEVAFGAPVVRQERRSAPPTPAAAPLPPRTVERNTTRTQETSSLEKAPVSTPVTVVSRPASEAPQPPAPPPPMISTPRPTMSVAELTKRATASVEAGRPAAAIADYKAALALTPDNGVIRYNLATALYLAERFADAAAAYREVVEENPSDEDAWLYLGLAEMKAGRREDGRQALRRVLALNSDNAYARATLGE